MGLEKEEKAAAVAAEEDDDYNFDTWALYWAAVFLNITYL